MFGFEKLSTTTRIFILLVIFSFVICNSNDEKEEFNRKIRRFRRMNRSKRLDAIRLMRLRRRWGRYLRRLRRSRGYDQRCYSARQCYVGRVPTNEGSVKSCKTWKCSKDQENKVCTPKSVGSKGKYWCCKKGKWVESITGACTTKPVSFCRNIIRCY